MGATVGSVIPTKGAIIPAAVGVDIGCRMMAVRTSLHANDLPDTLLQLRTAIERAVPHGRTDNGGAKDRGAWQNPPTAHNAVWAQELQPGYDRLVADHAAATAGIECRKDAEVIDETPAAYKPISDVMHAQRDLVEIVYTLRQMVCVKG